MKLDDKKPKRKYAIFRVRLTRAGYPIFAGWLLSFDFSVSGKVDDNNVTRWSDEGPAHCPRFTNAEANAVLTLLRPIMPVRYELQKAQPL